MSGFLPPSFLAEISQRAREAGGGSRAGLRIRFERSVSSPQRLSSILSALGSGTVQVRGSVAQSLSPAAPTAVYAPAETTVALWHMDEGSGSVAEDSTDNGNDLDLYGATWTSGRFSYGLSFDGVSAYGAATLTSLEPVRRLLYFGCWSSGGSGPIFDWPGVLSVSIASGEVAAEVAGVECPGPAVGSGWQPIEVQFLEGTVLVGCNGVYRRTATGLTSLAPETWDVTVGRKGAEYYSGLLDEVILQADGVLCEDFSVVPSRPDPSSVLHCLFDAGAGTEEHHADFMGPSVWLVNASWTSGRVGRAIELDGSAGYAMFTPQARAEADRLTIQAVIRPDSLEPFALVDQEAGISLRWDGESFVAPLEGVSAAEAPIGPVGLSAGEWQEVALTYDGEEKAVWLNGVKAGAVAAEGTAVIPASPVYVGRTVAGSLYFDGAVDVLSISRTKQRPRERPIQTFLLGYHGFEPWDDWVLS